MKKILLLMFCVFFLALTTAETSFYLQKGEISNLSFVCEDSKQPLSICSPTTSCNISIFYPNSSLLLNNQATTNLNNGKFIYQLNENQTIVKGEYQAVVGCSDNGVNSSTQFIYEVNPTGIRPSETKTETVSNSIYFTLILGVLFFLGFLFVKTKAPTKWTFFIFAFFFFLMTLNILFVGIQDEVVNPALETFFDKFTAASYYIYWFLAGIMAIMWFLTFLSTYFYNKNLNQMRKYG